MAEFEVILYEKENGDCPVEEFICSLDVKMRAKWLACLNYWKKRAISLENHTVNRLMMEYLRFGVRWEIIYTRVLYFFYYEGKIMKTLQQLKEEQMKDPAFAKEYDAIQPEMDVIRAIVDARTSQNMTQKELAERTGINQADISKLENGTRNPSVNLLKRLADGMGMALKIEFVPKQKI